MSLKDFTFTLEIKPFDWFRFDLGGAPPWQWGRPEDYGALWLVLGPIQIAISNGRLD